MIYWLNLCSAISSVDVPRAILNSISVTLCFVWEKGIKVILSQNKSKNFFPKFFEMTYCLKVEYYQIMIVLSIIIWPFLKVL